jgi:hypothetical protein
VNIHLTRRRRRFVVVPMHNAICKLLLGRFVETLDASLR